jgi:DNA-binding FadR family transcriptional regulator
LDLIRSGELGEGQRLPAEHRLAATYGVSRSVVREALGGLRSLGLIVSRVGSGSYVSRATDPILLGRYSAGELHEVRTHLEVSGAGLAAERASGAQRDRLRRLVAEMDACTGPRRWARLDSDFHVALAEATNNQVQVRLVTDLRHLLVEYSALANAMERGRRERAQAEHRRILDAVVAGDRDAARAAMALHLDRVAIVVRRSAGEDD